MVSGHFHVDVARLRAILAGLPEITESISYGTPMWKVGKVMLTRLREPGVVAIPCGSEDEKRLLIEAAPEICFTVAHYDGHALVLARMGTIGDEELRHLLGLAWRFKATPRIRKLLM